LPYFVHILVGAAFDPPGPSADDPRSRRGSWPVGRDPAGKGVCVKANDTDEFAGALIAQLPALRRYATALTGHAALADDLVQDCIERALKQAGKLEKLRQIGGWLRSILHNLYIDELRRRRRQGMNIDVAHVENDLAAVMPTHDHAAMIDFERAMVSLSVEHRQVLLLVGLEGLNYRQLADELEIPIGTVMSRLARARERLRKLMEQHPPTVPPAQVGLQEQNDNHE
jgi:RNA polymerase sigma-70 factor (ECF subfamily)